MFGRLRSGATNRKLMTFQGEVLAKARAVNVQFNDEPIDFSPGDYRLLTDGDRWFAWSQFNLAPSSNVPE